MPVGREIDTVHTREEALVGDPMSAPQSSVSASPSIKMGHQHFSPCPSSELGMNSPLGVGGGHVAGEVVPGETRIWVPGLLGQPSSVGGDTLKGLQIRARPPQWVLLWLAEFAAKCTHQL